jgi:hypothetical protein
VGSWIALAIVVGCFAVAVFLLRRNAKLATKVGSSDEQARIYREAHEKARKVQSVRAKPRRSPEQLMDRLRERAGDRPGDPPVS